MICYSIDQLPFYHLSASFLTSYGERSTIGLQLAQYIKLFRPIIKLRSFSDVKQIIYNLKQNTMKYHSCSNG